MSQPDDRPAGAASGETDKDTLGGDLREGATPGTTGALDGAAAAGSVGAVSGPSGNGVMPEGAPDPSVGPD